VGTQTQKILDAYKNATSGNWRQSQIPPLWDGKAAERIVKIMIEKL
jgi:UDP-N-acetylglucosamine 2-epimerase (non-hydrolysing)